MPKSRKKSNIAPRRKLNIFCEGKKTEPSYLNGYILSLEESAIEPLIQIKETNKNTAVQLVDEAVTAKYSRDSLPDDEFWVVYDREATAKYDNSLHEKAFSKAKKEGINVAISNVCFEYWILLHFEYTDAPFNNFEELISKSRLNEFMCNLTKSKYDKSCEEIFQRIGHKINDARKWGQRLNLNGINASVMGRDKPYLINPYVGIVELLDAIDKFRGNVMKDPHHY